MQEQMNSLNDSGDFQDVESNYSGRLSHVSSQPSMIPRICALPSRDKRLPLDTWNQSGLQENVLGHQFSTLIHREIILKEFNLTTCKETEKRSLKLEGRRPFTKWRQTKSRHNSNADVCDKAVEYEFYNPGGITVKLYGRTAKAANIGIAIRQIPQSIIILGVENKVQNTGLKWFWFTVGSYVMDQRSGDGWFVGRVKILAISIWKRFSKFRDAGREESLGSEQDHPEFPVQEEGQPRGAESPEGWPVSMRKTDRLHDLWLLSSDWCSWHCIRLCWLILCYSPWWQHSGIRYEMGRSSTVDVKNAIRWYLGKCVQIEDTWVWPTQNRVGIGRHGDSSEDIGSQLSKVENNGKEKYRSETPFTKLWRQLWESWIRTRERESKGNHLGWRWKRYLLPVERKRQCSQGDRCSFRHESQDRAQKPEHTAATPSEPASSRGRRVSRKRSIRGKSNHGSLLRQRCRYYLKGNCTRTSGEYWHPPECQFHKNETGCKAGDKCLFPHYKVDEQPNKKPKKSNIPKRRESDEKNAVCGYCEKCITIGVASRKTQMHSFLKLESIGETRCRKSWNQFKGYDLQSLRHVTRVSGTRKDHRWEK